MEGLGIASKKPSYLEAALHLQKAADSGVPQALHSLALLYEYGYGIAQDFHKAISLYNRAIELGQIESMYNLALMQAYGRGTPQDLLSARANLEKAAALNHAPSIYYIGVFKTYGYGCEINYDQAVHWFERAATLNDPRIQDKAMQAADSLKKLVFEAKEKNDNMLNSFQKQVDREG